MGIARFEGHPIEAVIFDMDGLMFDTQAIWDRMWAPALAPFGLAPTPEFVASARGMTGEAYAANIRAHLGPDIDTDAIYRRLERLVSDELARAVPKKPGLDELLARLAELGVPRAVASSSPLDMIMSNLRVAGVDGFFEPGMVVCGQDVEHGKPAPDIFLLAARRLGVAPARAMVLEDSFAGVRAGTAGGFVTVMVPDAAQPTSEIRALATAVRPSLADVARELQPA